MKDCLKQAESLLNQYVDKGWIPCGAVALVTQEDAFTRYAGNSSIIPEKIPLSQDAIFDLASVSKAVGTTTIALQCMEQGIFNLKTTVRSILPDFPYEEVTIEHLMTHTSGICSDDKKYKQLKDKEELRRFFFEKPLEYAPGTKVSYSDFGYIALGFILEKLAGNLDDVFRKSVAAPLGMKDTCYCPSEKGLAERCVPTEVTPERGVIKGVVHDGKAYLLGGLSGNAGLFSTLEDMTHFVKMMLNDGCYEGKRILSKASVNLLKKCYTSGLNDRRTLGWLSDEKKTSLGDYYSDCCIFHTGFTGTSVYIDFKRKCGIVLLTNRIHPSRDNTYIKEVRNNVHNAILSCFDSLQG